MLLTIAFSNHRHSLVEVESIYAGPSLFHTASLAHPHPQRFGLRQLYLMSPDNFWVSSSAWSHRKMIPKKEDNIYVCTYIHKHHTHIHTHDTHDTHTRHTHLCVPCVWNVCVCIYIITINDKTDHSFKGEKGGVYTEFGGKELKKEMI